VYIIIYLTRCFDKIKFITPDYLTKHANIATIYKGN